jgi:succinoglycan biosynthesis protein ExoA
VTAGTSSGSAAAAPDLVTVVIPARNEEASIGHCLRSVLSQTYRGLEVLVVDGASTDRTADIVHEHAASDDRVRLIPNPAAIIPRALNLAAEAARGRWLVRVDAHAAIPPDYVQRVVEHLRTGRWGGVGGRKDGVGRTPAGRAVAAAMASRFGVGGSVYHWGTEQHVVDHIPFGAYPTELVRQLGGWDERLNVNEDVEFDLRVRRAGYDLLFDPTLEIAWECRQSVRDLARQYWRYGRGKAMAVRIEPGTASARHAVAPALCAWLAGALIAAPRAPRAAAAAVAPYAAALAVASALVSRRVEPGSRRYVPAAFAAMHLSWGAGLWRGLLDRGSEPPPRHGP